MQIDSISYDLQNSPASPINQSNEYSYESEVFQCIQCSCYVAQLNEHEECPDCALENLDHEIDFNIHEDN